MKNILILILLTALIFVSYQYQQARKTNEVIVTNDHSSLTANQHQDDHSYNAIDNSPKQNIKQTHNKETANNDKDHTHIPKDIRTALCIEKQDIDTQCTINTALNIQATMLDKATGNINTEEVSTIMASSNFSDVLEHLTTNKTLTESFEREITYNAQLNDITNALAVSSQGIYCGDISCATSISYKDEASWLAFKQQFFMPNDNKGNLFINQLPRNINQDNQVRIIFFPGNNKAVTKRLKKSG